MTNRYQTSNLGRQLGLERSDGRSEEVRAALRDDKLDWERRVPTLIVDLQTGDFASGTVVLADWRKECALDHARREIHF